MEPDGQREAKAAIVFSSTNVLLKENYCFLWYSLNCYVSRYFKLCWSCKHSSHCSLLSIVLVLSVVYGCSRNNCTRVILSFELCRTIAQDLITKQYFALPCIVVVMFSTVVHSRLVSPDLITELYFSLPHQRQARSSNALRWVLPTLTQVHWQSPWRWWWWWWWWYWWWWL